MEPNNEPDFSVEKPVESKNRSDFPVDFPVRNKKLVKFPLLFTVCWIIGFTILCDTMGLVDTEPMTVLGLTLIGATASFILMFLGSIRDDR